MKDNKCRLIAADIVIVDRISEEANCVLIKRGNEPFKGMFALPGGLLEMDESIEECAKREAEEETGIKVKLIKMISVESDPARDPRHVISIPFLATGDIEKAKAGDDAKEIKIVKIKEAMNMELAADHAKILSKALKIIKEINNAAQ